VEESSRRRFTRHAHVKNWNLLFYCSNIAKSEDAMLWRKTITEHAHNLYRMSSNAYDLHYCPGSKNYRRQNKMTFSPELYIVALIKWMVYVLYIFACTCQKLKFAFLLLEYCKIRGCYAVANTFTIRNMYCLLLYMKCNSRKINRPTKNITKIVTINKTSKSPHAFAMCSIRTNLLKQENEKIDSL
jgi:hypothetical protein